MRRFLSLLVTLLVFSGATMAQTKQVTGKVFSSENDQPIPGANVFVKEAPNIGAITDIDGAYSLKNIPGNAQTLVFRFVGYKTVEKPIEGRVVNVTLSPENQEIDEVVVTAMGMKKEKKALGYAAQDLKGSDLNKAGTAELSHALQGKLSGVDITPSSGMPGASTKVVIRGARSFTGNNTPLYVVDGMPIASTADFSTGNSVTGTDISDRSLDLDPNEIESINILKGQAAAALYGIRASNGVVVITTKSGKGLAKGKPVVTFNNNTSIEQISRKPDLQRKYAQGSYGSFIPNSSMAWGPTLEELPNDATYGGNVANSHTNLSGLQIGKYYVPQLAKAGLDPWATPTRYNNVDDFFRTGVTVNNSLNVSQSTENGNFSIGFGSSNQQGIIPSTQMDRYNARALAETSLGKAWRAGFTANFVTTDIDKAPSANSALLGTVYPAPVNYNLKGIPYHVPGDPYTQINYRSLTFNNPYWASENNVFNEKNDRFFGNSFFEFTPQTNWREDKKLVFRYQIGVDSYTTHYQNIYSYGNSGNLGEIENRGVTHLGFNSLFTANYSMNITDDLQLTALLGNEVNQSNDKTYTEIGKNFNFGGWTNIGNANVISAAEGRYKSRTVGFFGNLSLTYKNMLFLNATGRNDYVSTMPRNHRSFFYPSVSLAFILTELEALKNNDVISFLKIRGSYAQVGQAGDYLDNYFTIPNYDGGFWTNSPITYPINGINSYIPNTTLYDPGLKPQNTKSYEAGFDLKMFKNVVSLEYTYSRQNVTDQIFPVPLAGSSGVDQLVMNGGKIHTNTNEILVSVRVLNKNNMEWTVGANFTKIDNYVDELASGVESIFLGGFVTPQVRAGIGDKYPVIYGTQFMRDSEGRILIDEDPDSFSYGMPMPGEPGVIGNCSPDFIVGGNTSFRWNRLTANVTVSWQKGGQMYSGTNGLLNLYGSTEVTSDRTTPFVYPGYKADGTKNDIVRGGTEDPDAYQDLYSNILGNIDEAYIYDMDFVKLREISLGYSFPRYKGISITMSAFARNILVWTKLPNLDPESSQGNNNMGGYFERLSLPQSTSYGLGLNVVF